MVVDDVRRRVRHELEELGMSSEGAAVASMAAIGAALRFA